MRATTDLRIALDRVYDLEDAHHARITARYGVLDGRARAKRHLARRAAIRLAERTARRLQREGA